MNTLLVAGFSTRHVVSSARKAGYSVYAIDHFCDHDLREMVLGYERFEECAELPDQIRKFCKKYPIDAILVTSGAEDLNGFPIPVIGTDPVIANRFLDKELTQQFLEELGGTGSSTGKTRSIPGDAETMEGLGRMEKYPGGIRGRYHQVEDRISR